MLFQKVFWRSVLKIESTLKINAFKATMFCLKKFQKTFQISVISSIDCLHRTPVGIDFIKRKCPIITLIQ